MTFAARPHQVAATASVGVQALGTLQLSGSTPSSSARGVDLLVNTNGTLSFVNQMDGGTSIVPLNWYLPTTTTIGSSYRVRFTLQSGNAWDAGLTSGTYYTLDAQRKIAWTVNIDQGKIATALIEIAAVGNNTVLGSGTLNINILNDY